MCRIALQVVAVSLVAATSGSSRRDFEPKFSESESESEEEADTAPADETSTLDALEQPGPTRSCRSRPRRAWAIGVTGHVWGGYDGGQRGAVGEAVVDGKVSRSLALRVDALIRISGGARRRCSAPGSGFCARAALLDLGVGVVYQPQSIRGDGIVTATVSLGKTIGVPRGPLGCRPGSRRGRRPRGDVGRRGLQSQRAHSPRARRSGAGSAVVHQQEFASLEQPIVDFTAGPLLAYALRQFDIIAYGGIASLMLKAPPELAGNGARLQLGPLAMLGVGAAL